MKAQCMRHHSNDQDSSDDTTLSGFDIDSLIRTQASKPCYPTKYENGLTFRERLIIAYASNCNLTGSHNAISHADRIIKEMCEETSA